jgi:hypothetical protein
MATRAAHLCARAFERAREHRGGNHAAHGLTVPSLALVADGSKELSVNSPMSRECAIDPSARLDWARLARRGARLQVRAPGHAVGRVAAPALCVGVRMCAQCASPSPSSSVSRTFTYIHPLRQFIRIILLDFTHIAVERGC